MNSDFLKTLDALDNATTSRRDALRKAGRFGANAALAAVPFLASAKRTMAKRYGARFETDVEILNFALTLEYLEYYFYLRGVGNRDLITVPPDPNFVEVPEELDLNVVGSDVGLFREIRDNEDAHITVLTNTIMGLGADPVVYSMDDFTFEIEPGVSVYDDYQDFLTLAQGFEDTGVRAYKGQAADIDSAAVLTAALQIHSVEARHAAAVRRLRGLQGWIPFDQDDAPAAIQATYLAGSPPDLFPAEDNTTQGGVELVSALMGPYTAEQITEAFDEPLDEDSVLAIAGPFITGEPDPFGSNAGR